MAHSIRGAADFVSSWFAELLGCTDAFKQRLAIDNAASFPFPQDPRISDVIDESASLEQGFFADAWLAGLIHESLESNVSPGRTSSCKTPNKKPHQHVSFVDAVEVFEFEVGLSVVADPCSDRTFLTMHSDARCMVNRAREPKAQAGSFSDDDACTDAVLLNGVFAHGPQNDERGSFFAGCPCLLPSSSVKSPPHSHEFRIRLSLRPFLDQPLHPDLCKVSTATTVLADLISGLAPCSLFADIRHLEAPAWVKQGTLSFPISDGLPLWEPGSQIHVWSDGSEIQNHAGSAFAVMVWRPSVGWSFAGVCAASSKASTMGEEIFDACEAEAAALVQAMSWLLACPLGTSMFLHYDCNSAGLAVTGDWKIPEGPSGAPCRVHRRARALFLLLQALGHDVKVEHVEAHTGDLMNELADCAAKAAAQCGPFSPWLRDDWKQVLVSDLVEWLWLLPWHARSYELPSLWDVVAGRAGDHVAKDFSSATLVPDVKKVPVHRPVDTVATCQWRVGTFNACTLRDGDDRSELERGLYVTGRQKLVQFQVRELGVCLCGIQETRLPASSSCTCDDWICLGSACDSAGQGGCSLWCDARCPFASKDGSQSFISLKDCHVVCSLPRLLIVRLACAGISCVCVVGHAPHELRPWEERSQWWRQCCRELVAARKPSDEVILFLDANARIGLPEHDLIGEVGAERCNSNGELLLDFIASADLRLPATTSLHQGPSHTWVSPTGFRARLDYVVVSSDLAPCVQSSWVVDDIDLMLGSDHDHKIACLDIALQKKGKSSQQHQRRLVKLDPALIHNWQVSAWQLPGQRWGTGVDKHLAFLSHGWFQAARKFEHKRPIFRRQSYVTDEIVAQVRRRKKLKLAVKEAQHASDLARVWCAFATWNRNRAAVQRADRALHFADVLTAVRWRAFFRLGKEVRAMLKTAKANKLSELAIRFRKVAEHGDTKQLFKALAPFRPGGQRLASVQPTMAVRGPSGEPFPDKAALAEFWSDHFGQIEGGERVSEQELHDSYVEHASSVVDFRPCLDELPSVIDWEMCFRGLQAGKSPGPDGLSHDLIKAAGTAVPLKSYPLALKVAVTGVEPLRWRGGLAWAIFKRKGNGSQASHYRSILVSDVLGKRFHSWVRRSLSPTLEGFAPELQHGPVGKHAISEIALLVRTFQEHMRERRISHALLFVDVQQAFYSLVRQLLLREESDIKDLVLLCETLKFSHDHIALVLQTFEHEGVGLDSLSSTWKSRLKDLCASTWFHVFGDSSPVRTLRGSKPGDPLADLLYGFVMASILKDIEGQLIDAGVVPSISVVGIMPQTNAEATHVPCAAAWQDDAVFMLGVDRACDLLPACRRAARLVHQCFQSRCLELNYTSGKTELVCSPVGVGAKKAKLDICKDPVLKLAFLPDVGSAHTVGCVPIYKHLGSFVDMSASLLPDINRRLGQAGSLIRPLRKRVFGDPHVALSTRRMIFRSLVLSRALVNVAAWSGMRIAEKLAWQSGVLHLYGALLVGPQAKHDAHVSHRELLRAVGLPAPIDLLRLERLRLLAQLLHKSCSRVHELLEASIGAQRCWLTEILDDWQWLRGLLSLSIPGDQEDVSIALGYLAGRTSQLSAWVRRAWYKSCANWAFCEIVVPRTGPMIVHQCPFCCAKLRGKAGLAGHLALKHGLRSKARFLVRTATCPACLKCFHTRSRLLFHLQRSSPKCFSSLCATETLLSNQVVRELDSQERNRCKKGRRRSMADRRPVVQTDAPMPTTPVNEEGTVPTHFIEDFL